MSQLRRYDPFAIEPVGDMFQGLLRSFRGGVDGGLPFKVDVTESDTAYNVVAEIPGAKKEDIDVTVDPRRPTAPRCCSSCASTSRR